LRNCGILSINWTEELNDRAVSDVQLYAGDFLQKHGEVFLLNFNLENVVDKAAEMLCVFMDDDLDWREIRKNTKSGKPLEEWT